MSNFWERLGLLLRTGDTRSLELVVGLIAMIFSGQLGAMMVGVLPMSALVYAITDPAAWLLVLLFGLGGLAKVLGAILDRPLVRAFASISLSGVWLYLSYLCLLLGALFSLLLFLLFALQSAWVYIRLSLVRKHEHAT